MFASAQYDTRCILAVPLLGEEGETLGVLQVTNRVDGRSFDKDDIAALQARATPSPPSTTCTPFPTPSANLPPPRCCARLRRIVPSSLPAPYALPSSPPRFSSPCACACRPPPGRGIVKEGFEDVNAQESLQGHQ